MELTYEDYNIKMMIKFIFLTAFLALAACEQAGQEHYQDQYQDKPYENVQQGNRGGQSDELQNERQLYNNYPPYKAPFNFNPFQFDDEFRQYEVIALVNNKNETLGYVYSVNSETARQQQENFIPVNDAYENLVAFYSLKFYRPGQEDSEAVEPPSENVVQQLQQFGFNYVQRNQEATGFFVVRNPYVFYFNDNGVLSPRILENSGYYQRQQAGFPNGQYPQQYGYRYDQQYPRPYYPPYQGPYAQYQYPGPYYQQYQGPYARYPYSYYQHPAPY